MTYGLVVFIRSDDMDKKKSWSSIIFYSLVDTWAGKGTDKVELQNQKSLQW